MSEIISGILLITGAAFVLLAAIGLLRMPDLFLRLSATSKAATLGVGLVLLATVSHFDDISITSRAIAVIVFVLMTIPVAAHMIGRAAYFNGTPLWNGTLRDELKGRYDHTSHRLECPPGMDEKKHE
jgi:multicomponent Na+:H+ antiporter subunit G